MSTVKLIALSTPSAITDCHTASDLVAYTARVSNPANQNNLGTAPKLIQYLVRENHWSPFEMVHITMEINTTRDIGRQILRHRSFAFQEFSQRYAMAGSLRSWIHYCELRMANGTQKEHMDVAKQCWSIIGGHFPDVVKALEK